MPDLTREISTDVSHEVSHEVHHDVSFLEHVFTTERILGLTRAALVMAFMFVVARVARRATARLLGPRLPAEQALLLERAVTYSVLGLACAWALREMGFEISVLLGAAGGVTLAVGFAAQTSVANIISGLFLIFEKPFGMGDSIDVGGVSGEVLSIDLLSIKLRTAENLFVRVPNEMVLKSAVTNMTRFDVRAFTMPVWVDVGTDIPKAQAVLQEVAKQEPKCLSDRPVAAWVASVDGQGVQMNLTVWAARADVAAAKSALYAAIGVHLKQAGITLPPPVLTARRP